MASPRPCVIAVLPGIISSTLINIVRPLLHLSATSDIDFRLVVEQYPNASFIGQADLVVLAGTPSRDANACDCARP
jgi:hypothetical protein